MTDLFVENGVLIPAAELRWSAVRASGPGGQNVNKVSTKVELRFDLEHSTVLGEEAKRRARAKHANKIDADGWLVITSQTTRSQQRNLEDARERLAGILREALHPPKRRRKTKPSRASKARRLTAKRRQGEKKRERARGGED